MAKQKQGKQRKGIKNDNQRAAGTDPWISQRLGLIIMGAASLILAILVIVQVQSSLGLGQALIWGLGFGLSLWIVFLLFYAFNRWIRRR